MCECVRLCVFTHVHMYVSVHECVFACEAVHTQPRTEGDCELLTNLKLKKLKEGFEESKKQGEYVWIGDLGWWLEYFGGST